MWTYTNAINSWMFDNIADQLKQHIWKLKILISVVTNKINGFFCYCCMTWHLLIILEYVFIIIICLYYLVYLLLFDNWVIRPVGNKSLLLLWYYWSWSHSKSNQSHIMILGITHSIYQEVLLAITLKTI